jgi:DNA polymerase-3 subunit gamma/tau
MTLALARKWRPKAFAELVGQEHVVRALTNALAGKRLHHAWLFTGTRGVGKTTLARIVAKSLNCETGVTAEPCGTCGSCVSIDAGRFIDVMELDAASNTQVDNMRELLDNALYAPTSGRYKVYIIDEVHMLSRNAFNAMLKTLEEPPEHVKFILATTDPQKIPVTVLSRCLQFNLKQIPLPQIRARLRVIVDKEEVESEDAALGLLARAAEGSMRDALSLLDQAIAHGAGKVEEDAVRDMLGAVDRRYLIDILNALVGRDGQALIAQAQRMAERNLSFDSALEELATLLHRLALAQSIPGSVSSEYADSEAFAALVGQVSAEDLQLMYQIALHGRRDLGLAPDEYAGFTMTLLRMLTFFPDDGLAQDKTTNPGKSAAAKVKEKSAQMLASGKTTMGQGDSRRPESESAQATKSESNEAVAENVRPVDSSAQPNILDQDIARYDDPEWDKGQESIARQGIAQEGIADQGDQDIAQGIAHEDVAGRGGDQVPIKIGDWRSLVKEIKLGGMARMLADHCELRKFESDVLELSVSEPHRHLLEPAYKAKLQSVLRKRFGERLRVKIEVGGKGNTPAAQEDREKQEKLDHAIEAIDTDPFVRDLVENLDAKVVDDSIKPAS